MQIFRTKIYGFFVFSDVLSENGALQIVSRIKYRQQIAADMM